MTNRFWGLPRLTTLLFVVMQPLCAQSKPLELKWNELANMINGHHVAITLNEGLIVGGEVAAVREDVIVLDVQNTARGYPKGNGSVPRSAVTLIALQRSRGSWGRALGTTIGVIGGLTLGGYAAAASSNSAGTGIPVFLGIAGGTSVAGYYLGRELDRRVTWIKIVP